MKVLLRGSEPDNDGLVCDGSDSASVNDCLAYIGSAGGGIRIEDHDVARPEVAGFAMIAQDHTGNLFGVGFLLAMKAEMGKDVSHVLFLVKRRKPGTGKTRGFLGLVANLGKAVLQGQEGVKTLEVLLFERGSFLDVTKKGLYPRTMVFEPQGITEAIGIEIVGGQGQEAGYTSMAQVTLLGNIHIAHPDGVEEQLGCKAKAYQRTAVFAIEEKGMQLLVVVLIDLPEIVAYDGHIE
jgi:hypothetical protein